MNMIINNGKILINFDPAKARRVQDLLFRLGYQYTNRPHKRRPGCKVYGISFTTTFRTTTINGKAAKREYRVIRFTSRPEVFRYYPGQLVGEDLHKARVGELAGE